MASIVDQYCWGCQNNNSDVHGDEIIVNSELEQIDKQASSNKSAYAVKQRKRKTRLPDLDYHLKNIMKLINEGESVCFEANSKTTRGLHNGESDRRSRFIGVLKGKSGWQTLINVGRTKRYIGTYYTEDQAALVHDFYSIGINGLKAKTNFDHETDQLKQMIVDYYKYDKMFNPTLYEE